MLLCKRYAQEVARPSKRVIKWISEGNNWGRRMRLL